MPNNTKKMPPQPHKPMSRADFDAWKDDLVMSDALQNEMFDVKGFIADVKRFNPKAGALLEELNTLQDKLVVALKG